MLVHRVPPLVLAALVACLSACPSGDEEDPDLEPDPDKGFLSGMVTIGFERDGVVTADSAGQVRSEAVLRTSGATARALPVEAAWTTRSLPPRSKERLRTASRVPSPLWRTSVIPGELLVVRRPSHSDTLEARSLPAVAGLHAAALPRPNASIEHLRLRHPDGGLLSDEETHAAAARLAADPTVVSAEPNRWVLPAAVPNDTWTPLMWSYELMRVPQAWDVQPDARDIVVAVLDTGVIPTHPDLIQSLLPGMDLISNPDTAGDGDGRDTDPTDEGGDWEDGSSTWHGTHVGGTIAAQTHNGLGIPSVTWRTSHLPVRVLGRGGGDFADILAAISWAAGLNVGGLPVNPHPAHVMNLSLGALGSPSAAAQSVIDEVTDAGHLLVVAAGNEDVDSTGAFPCNQQRVICVASVGADGRRATYSNFGAAVTVAAPGGMLEQDLDHDGSPDGVLSTSGTGGGYVFQQGTSMATPQVTALVALVQQAHLDTNQPLPTFEAVRDLLTRTATPLPDLCPEGCGAGLVNAEQAVRAVHGTGATTGAGPGVLQVATETLRLSSTDPAQLVLRNAGDTPLLVAASFTSATTQLALDFPGGHTQWVAPSGTTTLQLAWRPASLPAGSHVGTLHLTPSAGVRLDVPVELTLAAPTGTDRPVEVTVSARASSTTWRTVASKVVTKEDGHAFRFQLFPGNYRVTASVDEDGDGVFSEVGERRGGYPLFEQPELVTVTKQGQLTDIDFVVGSNGAAPNLVGTQCASNAACGEGGTCLETASTYCSASCGWGFPACPSGSTCLWNEEEPGLCLSHCTPDATERGSCRTGQSCIPFGDGHVCYPN